MNTYIVIVIPANQEKDANQDADKLDTGKTSQTFTVGLSTTGQLPISHLWCSWWMSDEKLRAIKTDFNGQPDTDGTKHKDKLFDLSQGWTPKTILNILHLNRIKLPIPRTNQLK